MTMPHDAARRRLALSAALAAPLWLAGRATRAQAPAGEPLTIALSPFLSPASLLAAFRPLREHLERTLARPVEMRSAKDFRSLCDSVRQQQQDAAMLPAHLARLAITDWGHRALAATVESLDVLVLVRRDSPAAVPADLRGGTVAMLDPLALTATVGRQWLQEQGLLGAVTVQTAPSINSALFALDRGDAQAIIAGQTQLLGLSVSTPRSDRVLATLRGIPGPIYVARPGLAAADFEALRAAMLSFRHDASRAVTAANSSLHAVSQSVLDQLDPLAAIARRTLAGG
jgi:phosphonate transport system substrate-binding protein